MVDMAHYISPKGQKLEDFDWKMFQKHMNLTDEELETYWKNDPIKRISGPMMGSWEMQNNWLIIEVIYSKCCGNGLKVGDRLYWEGLGNLDTTRSSRWCMGALQWMGGWIDGIQNAIMNGLDPNDFFPDTFSCPDTGSRCGWGQVVCRAYVVTRDQLDKLPPIPPIENLDAYFENVE